MLADNYTKTWQTYKDILQELLSAEGTGESVLFKRTRNFTIYQSASISEMEVINGVLYHAVGASGAALCYTPQKKVVGLELANLLAGTGIYLLVGITCCCCLFYYSAISSCIKRSSILCHATIFFSRHGVWNRRHRIWYCNPLCRFFIDVCYCCRYQLCVRYFITAIGSWNVSLAF